MLESSIEDCQWHYDREIDHQMDHHHEQKDETLLNLGTNGLTSEHASPCKNIMNVFDYVR